MYAIRHTLNNGFVSDWDDGRVMFFESVPGSWAGTRENAERLLGMFRSWGYRYLEIVPV
jgi:hypothetical protein